MVEQEIIVDMKQITKRFPGLVANDRVNLTLRKGQIHALLGENGAGKSTLMSVLAGLYRPDSGELFFHGQPVAFKSPKDAIEHGIGMVHQHFKLVVPLTVAENVALGDKTTPFRLDLNRVASRIEELSSRYNLRVDPRAKIWQLSVGEQQRVEIIKMLYRGAEVLILDEPTAVLTPQEADDLFHTLRQMADAGCAVVLITHKLKEVMAGSDLITVLRNGRNAGTLPTAETTPEELASLMVGREIVSKTVIKRSSPGKEMLSLSGISALNDQGLAALTEVNFSLAAGEILGVAGVAGNGQRELAEIVTGLRSCSSGKIILKGKDYTNKGPADFIKAGVAHIPEDRLGMGLVPNLNAVDNVLLKSYKHQPGTLINFRESKALTKKLVTDFQIKLASVDTPVKLMSGGNLQKLLLAREFENNPDLIVAVHPVRGLDISATEAVHNLLQGQKARGAGILLISEDLDELLELADRIAVIYEGRIMGILPASYEHLQTIGLMMAGNSCGKEEGA